MTCGSCPFIEDHCYTSMPPRVRCTITGEYRYYSDDCSCQDIYACKSKELDYIKKKLSEPEALVVINHEGPNAASVTFTKDDPATTYESLLNPPRYGEADEQSSNDSLIKPAVWPFVDQASIDKYLTEPLLCCTRCLICDIEVPYHLGEGSKVCPDCRKAIKFIKENFKKELDSYEM